MPLVSKKAGMVTKESDIQIMYLLPGSVEEYEKQGVEVGGREAKLHGKCLVKFRIKSCFLEKFQEIGHPL